MPSKSSNKPTITAISIDNSVDNTILDFDTQPTESQHMEKIDEPKLEEPVLNTDTDPPEELEELSVPAKKQRAKAKPKVKPVEIVQPIEEVKQMEVEEPIFPVKKQRAQPKPKMKPVEVVQPIEEVNKLKLINQLKRKKQS